MKYLATSYQLIYDKFIKKIKNDDQFFNYKNLPDEVIEELVNDHLISLLERSIEKIYNFGLPDVNFHNKNDELKEFNFELIPQEISLLSDLMYLNYFDEERNKLKVFGVTFRSSELNVFSPANDRKSFLDMLQNIETEAINQISNYLSRDRVTWEQKSIYQSSGVV